MKDSDLSSYVDALTTVQGATVLTVDDGWVMIFTKERLIELLEKANDSDKVMIFIKSSEKSEVLKN